MICAALALCLGLCPALAAEEKFPAVDPYPGFADVAEGDWFFSSAKLCFEIGIMTGTDLGFEPGKVLTVAECATVAARIRETLTGQAISASTSDSPWYVPYADYMRAAEPTLTPMLSHPTEPISRMQYLLLLNAAIPGDMDLLEPINSVGALPDVENETVLAFYNAGILTGVDKFGTFAGDRTLTRAECAAMVARTVRSDLRLQFTPADYAPFTAAYMEPGTVVFDNGVTAEEFLYEVNISISAAEYGAARRGQEFNWHYADVNGKTTLENVKAAVLDGLAEESMGTQAYKDFDYQVYYSRLIDLTGETLEPKYAVGVGA